MPALDLGLFRLLYCGTVGLITISRYKTYGEFIRNGAFSTQGFYYHQYYIFGSPAWWWLRLTWWVSIFMAAAGIFSRVMLTIAIISLVLFIAPLEPPPYDSHLIFFVLLVLLFSPGIQAFGIDGLKLGRPGNIPCWPKQLIILCLSMVYLSAGLTKLFWRAGWRWLLGTSVQVWIYRYYLQSGSGIALFVASRHWLCLALTWFTIFLELFFFLIVFFPRLKFIMVPMALIFHVCTFFLLGLVYFILFCPVYFIFIEANWFKKIGCAT